ncbi:ferritin-like domain-containing protein [Auraticoccus monumenti]|uniref:Tat (Twin-arginine translocation) pathway signal sequence n=1 Tax=Auraticoccus monumenti TaxID=675864 RepID=A0A1G7BP22_9ACTN|nr:ferritin-like domain-containing protein [Auraticoccus monumenti]SDE28799.1 Tat (twin-arginine translocation) pathway signal sequence [Auraticoccus monumenti]
MKDFARMVRPAAPVVFGGQPVINFRDENSRRRFLKTAAVIGAGSTLVAATLRDQMAFADASANDLEILNYALTLEYLEADFYKQGIDGGVLEGRDLELVEPIGEHEQAHVDALTQTIKDLGGTPAEKPQFVYPDGTFDDKDMFLKNASAFEELGVTAYHGQVPRIEDGDILAAAAAIAGVESRHAAVIADLLGENPFPAAFEKSMTMDEVLDAAGDFIES